MLELSAQEKIDYIKEALEDLKGSKISFLTFAMIVGNTIAPVPVTQADFDWALKTWKEIQSARVEQKEPDYCTCVSTTVYVVNGICTICGKKYYSTKAVKCAHGFKIGCPYGCL